MFKETRLEFSRTLPSPLNSPLFKYISATAKSDVCEARTNKSRWRTQKSGIDKTNEQALAVQIYMQHPACFSTPSTDTFAEFLSAESRDDVTESEQACWTLELQTNCDSLH